MKEVTLKSITLSNWKGQNRKVDFSRTTIIRAENGAGKTSLYNALVWLFTSYTDALNNKNHELYDNTIEINEKTPEASVSAVIEIDGIEYTIERKAKAGFSLNRETGLYEKDSSDKYTILLDNIETSATNFNKWVVANIGDTDLLLYALVGERFANLAIDDKKKARKVLEIVSGEVKLSDLKGDYSLIEEDIIKYSVEQLKERYRNQIKPLKQRVDVIEQELQNAHDDIAEYEQVDFNSIGDAINAKTKEIESIDAQILGAVDVIEPIQKQRAIIMSQIQKLTLELSEKKMQYTTTQSVRLNELKHKLNEVDALNRSIEEKNAANKREHEHNVRLLEQEKKNLKIYNKDRDNLLLQRDSIKGRIFAAEKCAYCGQELPVDEVEKLKDAFNNQKKKDLDLVVKKGKETKSVIEITEKRIAELEESVNKGFETQPLQTKADIESEYMLELEKVVAYEDTEEYNVLVKEISELKRSMPEIPTIDNSELTTKKSVLLQEIKELSRKLGKRDIIEKLKQEIFDLTEERKDVCAKIALMQGYLAKLVEYEEEKAFVISDRVNRKMKGCKVVMFSKQKNGDLIPDCVVVNDNGVKYSTINNSERIKMCLALQTMFAEHMGVKLPVFVDEASIFTDRNLPAFDRQSIYLYADNVNKMIVS